ncbi:Spermidine synthase [Lachnospiraceae bacterium G11]|jgi:spermidine synthase|nr:Spermidine synthase [Lachnospiraceae bacterium G11]
MERKILKNKLYLYLTEFFAGMSVMAVELGASRLLAPYFSSSQIVWTIIIGTIMIAMALGNLYGGKKADKDPNPDKLYGRILIAAIWIAAIPVVGKYIILGISGVLILAVNSNFLIIAAFIACMIIFVFPLFLLGTVTPSLVKFSVDSLDDSGSVVGKLNAFNTIGSIIGTFVPTFISIPAVGTSITFLIFAGILLILCIIYFVSSKINFKEAKKVPVSIVLFIVCCILGHNGSFAFWQTDLTFEGESIYNYLQVYENSQEVVLSTNVLFGVQSVYLKDKGMTGMYYDYAMAAPYMSGVNEKDNLDILILGNGSGTFATQCERYFDNCNIEGVEIDQKITDLAVEYFDLPKDVPVTTYDGRAYLNAIDRKYDVIMVDAYQDITIPFQMSSIEFFTLVKDHLKDDGVMVVNMNMRGQSEGNINQYLADTISHAFSEIYTVEVSGSTNRELFASNNPEMLSVFEENINLGLGRCEEELELMMARVSLDLEAYEPGEYLMTDDKAPVELLGMRVIDEIIKEEVAYYKGLYERGGLQALLDLL